MRILFFHSNGIVPTSGGISKATANIGNMMRKYGHDVWYLGGADKRTGYKYDSAQLFLPCKDVLSEVNIDFLRKMLKDKEIDVLINQVPFSVEYVRLLNKASEDTGTSIISCYHNSILTPIKRYAYCHEYMLKKNNKGWIFQLLRIKLVSKCLEYIYIIKWRRTFRETVNKSDVITLLCDGQLPEFLEMCGYSECGKISVVPNPQTTDVGVSEDKKNIVLWTGTFDYAIKRPDYMLRIWKMVEPSFPQWKLYMLGDGPSLNEMKELAKKLQLANVEFPGRVETSEFYKRAKIQCVTSVHEAFPLVTIEAMQKGNPVIAFDSFTSAPYIILDQKNGILVPPFALNNYAELLSSLMKDENKRQKMSKEAVDSINRFSEDKIYDLWSKIFDKLEYGK